MYTYKYIFSSRIHKKKINIAIIPCDMQTILEIKIIILLFFNICL